MVIGNPILPRSDRTFDRYFNTSAYALPAVGTIGTQWTPSIYGPGVNDFDLVLLKTIRLEPVSIQLRTEAYNVFNHTQFSGVNMAAQFDPATGKQVNTAFGQLNADRGPRILQLSARVSF